MTRNEKWALGAAALLALLVVPYELSPGKRFTRKPAYYFAELATACDDLLAGTSLPTNGIVEVDASSQSTPRIIRDLRPHVVRVSSNRVWILAGPGRIGGYAVTWEPDLANSGSWSLKIANDALDQTLFTK